MYVSKLLLGTEFKNYFYHISQGAVSKSLWPSGIIWRHRSGSTLAQVMACCLMAPSHYLNHCWLIIRKVLWHSRESIFHKIWWHPSEKNKIENCIFETTSRYRRDQWVKAADDDAGKLQSVFLKRLYLLHICIFSFFLFNASLTTI